MTASELLFKHGTNAFTLPPSAILHAAKNDLNIRRQKKEGECEMGRAYAFAAKHIRRADSPQKLIELALNDLDSGLASGKLNTRLIYSDAGRLRDALALAGQAA